MGDKGGHWCFGVTFYYERVWVGLGSQGHKPSYTRWEPQDLCALHWGAGMGSEGTMLLWGWVGPASSGLVLLAQVVAPGGFPAQVPH